MKNKKIDKPLFYLTIIFLVLGAILVFSASWPKAVSKYNDGYFFIKRHLMSMTIGFVAMFIAVNFDYKFYKKLIIPIILIAVILNLLLFTSFGEGNYGSTRWLDLPFLPQFMPSDVLKIASIMFVAYLLEDLGDNIRTIKGLFTVLIFIIFFVGLVLLKDMGTSAIMLVSMLSMVLVSGMKISHMLILILIFPIFAFFGLNSKAFAYRRKRILGFLDPFNDKTDSGWQLINSLYALALGGLKGAGLGKGVQKYSYIANVYNDFIFAVVGEEFGFIGSVTLVLLYLIFVWRGFIIASRCKDKFGKYLAVGLTTMIGFQAFIHIMVNIGIAPVTGITLPFISYGGTSLLFTMCAAGILMNISKKLD